MGQWLAWGIAFVVGSSFLARRASASVARGMDPKGSAPNEERQRLIMSKIRQASTRVGLPHYIALATAQSESRQRHLEPTGAGKGETFYPFGIQKNRGADIVNRVMRTNYTWDDPRLETVLADLDANIELGVDELLRGYKRHGDDHERVRMFWVYPAAARAGRPFPSVTGSVNTAHRLKRWNEHVAMFGGPPGRSAGVA